MNPLQKKMTVETIKFLVSHKIICDVTGELLDYRTCCVLLDKDGDPCAVYGSDMQEFYPEPNVGFAWLDRAELN